MSAAISNCGRYRYTLTRPGDLTAWRGPAVFVMLNPSTADADQDDNTIRRCRGFAQEWGCDGIVVVNLYAWRATKPAELWKQKDPVGPENDQHIIEALENSDTLVFAWGANARAERVKAVYELIARHSLLVPLCLGTTKDGSPRHPLYIKKDQPLIPWKPE